jgi:hypothetical protein
MNKIAIIAGLSGLVVGAAGGYFACHIIEKKKIDKAISDGIQQTLDEIRNTQREKVMENERKKLNIINAIPHFNAIDITKDILKDSGYYEEGSKDSTDDVKEPDDEPDDLPFEMGDIESKNIWDEEEPDESELTQDEYDKLVEPDVGVNIEKLDIKKKPYEITKEQYDEELMNETSEGMWDKVELIFFKDNVFAERSAMDEFSMMSSKEIELAIGKDNIKKFVDNHTLERLFVRNNKLQIDYMITRSPRSYSSAIHEDDEE